MTKTALGIVVLVVLISVAQVFLHEMERWEKERAQPRRVQFYCRPADGGGKLCIEGPGDP
jgi:hypothetical protein